MLLPEVGALSAAQSQRHGVLVRSGGAEARAEGRPRRQTHFKERIYAYIYI